MHVVSNIFQGGADWGSGSRTALTHMLLFVFYQMSHLGDFFLLRGWVGGLGAGGPAAAHFFRAIQIQFAVGCPRVS